MMPRGSRIAILAVLLVAGLASGGAGPQVLEQSVTRTGWVRMVTAEDGLTTAVTLTEARTAAGGMGIVDHAFRLQHLASQSLGYEGPATITQLKNRLVIAAGDHEGWVFTVAGRQVSDIPATAYHDYAVLGLSHYWGASVHRTENDVVMSLLGGTCGSKSAGGPCDKCERGSIGCSVECGDEGCAAECIEGYSACCSCTAGCGCCRDIEGVHPSGQRPGATAAPTAGRSRSLGLGPQ